MKKITVQTSKGEFSLKVKKPNLLTVKEQDKIFNSMGVSKFKVETSKAVYIYDKKELSRFNKKQKSIN
jgi:murein L,D-transpeptidase YcbB/YkuD